MENTIKASIRRLIGSAQPKEALDALTTYCHENCIDADGTIILLESRLTRLTKEALLGIISSNDLNLEQGKINHAILTLVDDLIKGSFNTTVTSVQTPQPIAMKSNNTFSLMNLLSFLSQPFIETLEYQTIVWRWCQDRVNQLSTIFEEGSEEYEDFVQPLVEKLSRNARTKKFDDTRALVAILKEWSEEEQLRLQEQNNNVPEKDKLLKAAKEASYKDLSPIEAYVLYVLESHQLKDSLLVDWKRELAHVEQTDSITLKAQRMVQLKSKWLQY